MAKTHDIIKPYTIGAWISTNSAQEIIIEHVPENSIAARMGIHKNDILAQLSMVIDETTYIAPEEGKKLSPKALQSFIARGNDTLTLTVLRNGQLMALSTSAEPHTPETKLASTTLSLAGKTLHQIVL